MTEQTSPTPFLTKTYILGELWLNYRNDPEFKDFIEYNDLGLPLAYAMAEGIVEKTDLASNFINEAYDILLSALGVEDTGFDTLNDLLDKD